MTAVGGDACRRKKRDRLEGKRVPASIQTSLTVIEPRRGWRGFDLSEIWHFRELVYILAWRDVTVRYKQTALGVAWAVIQPVLATAIFSVVFSRVFGAASGQLPYPLFAYAGFLAWTYFANAVSQAGVSLVRNSSLVSKVYFPRLIIPLAAVLPGLVDLTLGAVVLVILAWIFGYPPTAALFLAPVMTALLFFASWSVSIWFSALDVQYRDVRHVLPFLLQIWLFATPIVYPAELVPAPFRALYALNPLVGAVDGFRWTFFGQGEAPVGSVLLSVAVSLVVSVLGVAYFRQSERTFADKI